MCMEICAGSSRVCEKGRKENGRQEVERGGGGTLTTSTHPNRKDHIGLVEQQFGLFEGIPDEELPIRFPAEYRHYMKCNDFGGRFWARYPLGESRFDVAMRVHQVFEDLYHNADKHRDILIVTHGVTLRAFMMMFLKKTPEWFEEEPNPGNCALRLIECGEDKGYLFEGFHNHS
mmetsp:Transcript_37726/g.97336  ORF Transcript_37726/g.97336 Transcript_37726/m.97336 type:complete len:174 (-) Transcript_37726:304-825(-)